MSLAFSVGLVLGLIFILPLMQQGVGLIVVIFSLSILISFVVGFFGYVWYGFSLFLIYVGSLLVMFGYVIAMIPNFLFKHNNFGKFLLLGVFFSFFFSLKMGVSEGLFDVGGFMYSMGGFVVLIGLAFVLLFTLVCVVKICYFSAGSLRPFSL
uniref:NADH dehydrogenase subunit 6 n=1 Tax=Parborlasia corrugatus TaxID=187802 RepID=A0A3S5HLL0_PARCG|nr:NADH dehydrogenase subunit 6 [Parborlasia corrugatus]